MADDISAKDEKLGYCSGSGEVWKFDTIALLHLLKMSSEEGLMMVFWSSCQYQPHHCPHHNILQCTTSTSPPPPPNHHYHHHHHHHLTTITNNLQPTGSWSINILQQFQYQNQNINTNIKTSKYQYQNIIINPQPTGSWSINILAAPATLVSTTGWCPPHSLKSLTSPYHVNHLMTIP